MGSTTIVQTDALRLHGAPSTRPAPAEVRGQLSRLLASPLFQHSKHYPGLLRYVVHETLEGRSGLLKERALGVDVFGRDPNYDTNADPVVRTTAREVRKRLATYYQESGADDEVRIDLPAGAYVPEFRFNEQKPVAAPAPSAPAAGFDATPTSSAAVLRAKRNWIFAGIVALIIGGLGFGAAELRGTTDASATFWNPILTSSDPVMIVVGSAPEPFAQPGMATADHLSFSDAINMGRFSGIARERGFKKLDIRRAGAVSLSDLRKGPAILIGAFDNSWTMRLTNQLRFSFQWDETLQAGVIRDRENPSGPAWRQDPGGSSERTPQDYALVTRVVSPLTGKPVVMVGSIGPEAALAAGEFVTEPPYLRMLAARAPKGWERKNLQVVLAANIVHGNPSSPRIVATYFW